MKRFRSSYFKVLLIILALLLFLNHTGLLQNASLKFSDNFYGKKLVYDKIVIVEIDDESISRFGNWPLNRSVYAKLLHKLEASKVIGLDIGFYETSSAKQDEILRRAINQNSEKIVAGMEYTSFGNDTVGREKLVPYFSCQNVACGYVNIIVDRDGVARAVNLNVKGEHDYFATDIFEKVYGKRPAPDNRYMVNFAGEPGTIESYSLFEVVEGNINKSFFDEKIVLVGATSQNLHDMVMVPTSNEKLMPGVEFHANAVNTMIHDNEVKQSGLLLEAVIISLFVLLTGWVFHKWGTVKSLIAMIIACIAYFVFALIVFEISNIILETIFVWFAVALTYFGMLGFSFKLEQKRRQEIKSAFGRYVSPVLIEQMINNPGLLKLGGEKKTITILFSDIADFTRISEQLEPEQLTELMNEYLTKMTRIVLKNYGLVDKFIGDAIMCFWGAPIDDDNQTERACKCAVEMELELDSLKEAWKNKFGVNIDIRIGIHKGEAIVGNLGSEERFDYTAIGDSVNVASRLEAINKNYKTRICVSEELYTEAKDKFKFRQLDLVRVKGKTKPTKIYELNNKLDNKVIEDFHKALMLYRQKKFHAAKKIFENLKGKDYVSEVFLDRISAIEQKTPGKSWDGVFDMDKK